MLVFSELWACIVGDNWQGDPANRSNTDANGPMIPYRSPRAIPAAYRGMHWVCVITPLFESMGETRFPRPMEYNYLRRFLRIYRTENPIYVDDYLAFSWTSDEQRLLHASVYCAFHTVMITTVLHSYNITGTVMQQLGTNAPGVPHLARQVCGVYGFFDNVSGTPTNRAFVFEQMLRGVDCHVGGLSPPECFSFRSYNHLV